MRKYRQFYLTYPKLVSPVKEHFVQLVAKGQSPIAQFQAADIQDTGTWQSPIAKLEEEEVGFVLGQLLFDRLSYTHFAQLLSLTDELERAFYEIECMKGVWSVCELKRM